MSDQANKPPRRRAYMLHMWEERLGPNAQAATWRFRLEDPHSGKIRGFGDLAALTRFLQAELSATGTAGEATDKAPTPDGLMQRLQRKFMPLSDLQLGGIAAGSADSAAAELEEQTHDDDEIGDPD